MSLHPRETWFWALTIVLVVNYIQQPLPEGSTTGADVSSQPGALGMGQQAATGLTTCKYSTLFFFFFKKKKQVAHDLVNTFWCYVTPLVGAWIGDEFLGRLKTIQLSIVFAFSGHIILIISALPSVITHPQGSLGCFSVGLVVFGIGVGGFKYGLPSRPISY